MVPQRKVGVVDVADDQSKEKLSGSPEERWGGESYTGWAG